MLFIIIFVLSLFHTFPVFASELLEETKIWVQENQSKMNPFLPEANNLKKSTDDLAKALLDPVKTQFSCDCQKSIKPEDFKQSQILIFVSFSMPETSLKSLYQSAVQKGARLILRGLKEQSFTKTSEFLKKIKIDVDIDPTLFKRYDIQTVPTFVFARENQPLFLRGNVSLQYAEQQFNKVLTYE